MNVTLTDRAAWLAAVMQSSVSDAAKMRAYALFTLSDGEGHHFENQPEIEAAIGHRSTGKTSKHLWELADAGFVVIERKRVTSGHMSNGYWLAIGGHTLVGHTIVGTKRRNLRDAHTYVGTATGIDAHLDADGNDTRPIPDWAAPTSVGTTTEEVQADLGSDRTIVADDDVRPVLSIVAVDSDAQSLGAASASVLNEVVPTSVCASRRRCAGCGMARSSEMFLSDDATVCFSCERKAVSA